MSVHSASPKQILLLVFALDAFGQYLVILETFASSFRLTVFREREASFAHGGTNFFPFDT